MTYYEMANDLIARYERYSEGTELGDALASLISAANTLNGISQSLKAIAILTMVGELIYEDLEYRISQTDGEDSFDGLSPYEQQLYQEFP